MEHHFCGPGTDAFRPVLAYSVFFQVIIILALGPLAVSLLNLVIGWAGHSVIANTQVLEFFLTPLGLVAAVLFASVALALTYLKYAGLYSIWLSAFQGKTPSAVGAMRLVMRRSLALLGVALIQVSIGAACAVPFAAAAGLTYAVLLSGSDINYFLSQRPPEFITAIVIGVSLAAGVAVLFVFLYIRWIFAVPVCVIEGKRFGEALRRSASLVKGSFFRILLWLAAWHVARAILLAIFIYLLDILNEFVLSFAGENLGPALWLAAGLIAFDVLVLAGLALLDAAGLCLLISWLYRCRAGEMEIAETGIQSVPPRWYWLGWVAAGMVLMSTVSTSYLVVREAVEVKPAAVTAHRAGAIRAPENTMAALRQAIAEGADYAEIDVQETADGILVVLHDQDLHRVAGLQRNIWELTYPEVKDLDAGSWFGPEFKGERVPTLQEYIDASRGKIKLNIEMKYNGHDQDLAGRVVEMVEQNEFVSQCVITSLHYEGLQEIRRLNPEIQVGYIVAVSVGDLTKLDIDFLSLKLSAFTSELRARAKQQDLPIHVWTVNDREAMQQVLDRGVDNIITDDPVLARQAIEAYQQLTDAERMLLRMRDWLRG